MPWGFPFCTQSAIPWQSHPSPMPRAPVPCFILPPHMIRSIALRGSDRQRARALTTLEMSGAIRTQRELVARPSPSGAACALERRRTVYDAKHGTRPPFTRVRGEKDGPARDPAVNEAFDGAGATFDFFLGTYERCSIDALGMPLGSIVHFSKAFNNAFWDGHQMVYGDGDGDLFNRLTIALDVIGHELTHGITQHEAGLEYRGEAGALNESFSDIFGSLVKQAGLRQAAKDADWLIGAGLFTKNVEGKALRSLRSPGTAYDDDVLGKDPQPGHLRDFVRTEEDHGGVHINSGIPNRAFYLAATALGGFAWEKAGRIWYNTLANELRRTSDFTDCAGRTAMVAARLHGAGSKEERAVVEAWEAVGVEPVAATLPESRPGSSARRHRS